MPTPKRLLSLLVLALTLAIFAGCNGNGPLAKIIQSGTEQAAAGPLQNLAGGIRGALFVMVLAVVGVGVATKMFGLDLSMVGNPLARGVTWLFSKSKSATEQVVDTNAEILAELKKLNTPKT